jgi:hypothetical protein
MDGPKGTRLCYNAFMSRSPNMDSAAKPAQELASEPAQVLPFRRPGSRRPPTPTPVSDLAEYERRPDEPDDYRHRMIMNGLAFVATVLLIVGGIWIAEVMAHMRKDQDCVLTGRTGCAHVDAPVQER